MTGENVGNEPKQPRTMLGADKHVWRQARRWAVENGLDDPGDPFECYDPFNPASSSQPWGSLLEDYVSAGSPISVASVGARMDHIRYSEHTKQLRALRLWHWRQVIFNRKAASEYREGVGVGLLTTKMSKAADERDQMANRHIKFVQTLNSFFPTGDYAEYDAIREDGGTVEQRK